MSGVRSSKPLEQAADQPSVAGLRGVQQTKDSIVARQKTIDSLAAMTDSARKLLASGSVEDIRSLVSRKQISCATTIAAEDVRSWPDVVAVERDAERLRITVVNAEPVLRRLLTSDDRVRDVEVRRLATLRSPPRRLRDRRGRRDPGARERRGGGRARGDRPARGPAGATYLGDHDRPRGQRVLHLVVWRSRRRG